MRGQSLLGAMLCEGDLLHETGAAGIPAAPQAVKEVVFCACVSMNAVGAAILSPCDFAHKITSPEAIILLFPSEIKQFLQNCLRELNERPYNYPVGFRLF